MKSYSGFYNCRFFNIAACGTGIGRSENFSARRERGLFGLRWITKKVFPPPLEFDIMKEIVTTVIGIVTAFLAILATVAVADRAGMNGEILLVPFFALFTAIAALAARAARVLSGGRLLVFVTMQSGILIWMLILAEFSWLPQSLLDRHSLMMKEFGGWGAAGFMEFLFLVIVPGSLWDNE